uniref:GAIN-B domain-containing protein n=1 Tax=Callorhinchus milii TaxID=7868 RepID=A0A4W3H8E0_CALMI
MNKTSLKMDGLCHQSAREVTMQDIMSFASQLLADSAAWNRLEQEERLRVASTLLQTMERTAVTLALSLASPGFIHFPDAQLDLQVGVIDTERPPSQQRARLSTQGSSMDINWATIAGGETTGLAAVIFISYSNMDRFLKGAPYRAHTGHPTPTRTHLNSAVISAALSNRQSDPLPEAVNFTLKHKQEPEAGETLVCVYWNHSANGSHWSPRGCELTHCNQTHTSCKCQHLSSFSLLMAFNRELQDSSSDKAQRVITYVGITVSLVCLGTTIITFLVSSKVKNVITATHTQLCVSLSWQSCSSHRDQQHQQQGAVWDHRWLSPLPVPGGIRLDVFGISAALPDGPKPEEDEVGWYSPPRRAAVHTGVCATRSPGGYMCRSVPPWLWITQQVSVFCLCPPVSSLPLPCPPHHWQPDLQPLCPNPLEFHPT